MLQRTLSLLLLALVLSLVKNSSGKLKVQGLLSSRTVVSEVALGEGVLILSGIHGAESVFSVRWHVLMLLNSCRLFYVSQV